MARKTFASFDLKGSQKSVLAAMATALATLASGKNPDTSDYTLPVNEVGATPYPVATGTADAQGVVAAAGLRLLGYSVRESAGVAAVASFNLRNGTADDDPIIAVEELAANGAQTRWFGPGGIKCADGVFVERIAGETEIVLYTAVIV